MMPDEYPQPRRDISQLLHETIRLEQCYYPMTIVSAAKALKLIRNVRNMLDNTEGAICQQMLSLPDDTNAETEKRVYAGYKKYLAWLRAGMEAEDHFRDATKKVEVDE